MQNYCLRDENAVYHECGFSCDNEIFLRLGDKAYFITDARYTVEAKELVRGAKVIEGGRDLIKCARDIMRASQVRKVVYNPAEWTVDSFERLSKSLHVNFSAKTNFSQQKRIVKSSDELETLREAVRLGAKAFDTFALFIREQGIGLTEQALHFEAENIFKDRGRLGLSFSPIVAINANAAKPHALPTEVILKEGDLLLVDAGVLYNRFCSDRTRTAEVSTSMHFGKDQNYGDKRRQEVYDTVLRAQEAAIKAARPGMRCCEVDAIGRDIITKAGYGKEFVHSTGHGVGLDIHELPVISSRSQTILEPGMVFTVEPGIYLPNEFGVRIEDMVVVNESGVEVL